jgi:hypothetical protein
MTLLLDGCGDLILGTFLEAVPTCASHTFDLPSGPGAQVDLMQLYVALGFPMASVVDSGLCRRLYGGGRGTGHPECTQKVVPYVRFGFNRCGILYISASLFA